MVKEENLFERCHCSGFYKFNINKVSNPLVNDREAIVSNLRRLAEKHRFELLSQTLKLIN